MDEESVKGYYADVDGDDPFGGIVDELDTPGCAQCAVKHLSAALAHMVDGDAHARMAPVDKEVPSVAEVLAARAYINLGEVLAGYESHLWFAVGLLQRAEVVESFRGRPSGVRNAARNARLVLEQKGRGGVACVMNLLHLAVNNAALAEAHLQEARRELPGWGGRWPEALGEIPAAIEQIRSDYALDPASYCAVKREEVCDGQPRH